MESSVDKPLLPLDIITIILKSLPIKSIIRFRSVCRDWNNLIKTPYFIAEHARHFAHENPLLLLIEYDDSYLEGTLLSLRLVNHKMECLEAFSIPSFHSFHYGWQIIGSCNGLLLIEDDDADCPRSLFLWNPMIREVRKITHPTKDYFGTCKYGLGFSSIVNDYKIVKFYNIELGEKERNYCDGHHGAEVYSLSTNSWKEVKLGAIQDATIKSTAVNNDGTILWLGERDSYHMVVSFDIATEVFTLIPVPIPVRDHFDPYRTTLGLYQNKLNVFEHDRRSDSFSSTDSWVMEEVAGESGKSFNCTEVYRLYNRFNIFGFFRSLCIWRNELVCLDGEYGFEEDYELHEDYGLVCKSKLSLKLFNITTKKWKKFRNFSCDIYECHGCSYERSLVSVWNTQVE